MNNQTNNYTEPSWIHELIVDLGGFRNCIDGGHIPIVTVSNPSGDKTTHTVTITAPNEEPSVVVDGSDIVSVIIDCVQEWQRKYTHSHKAKWDEHR